MEWSLGSARTDQSARQAELSVSSGGGSLDEWGRSLQRLVDDVVLRRQIGKHGRRHVIEHFSVATAVEQMGDVFEHVARAA